MDVNYFDLGLWKKSHEIEMMLQDVIPKFPEVKFNIYGFEANPEFALEVQEQYKDVDNIKIYNLAISDHNGQEKIFIERNKSVRCKVEVQKDAYWSVDRINILGIGTAVGKDGKPAERGLGGSIFRSKNDMTDDYYDVESVLFSDWVSKNVTNIKEAVNVLKVNIEGAELYLFRDLISSGLIDDIHIFAGHHSHDILKVGELEEYVDEYFELIKDIKIHKYCGEVEGYDNVDMAALIREQIEKQIV